ncbi:hypothetical protein [Ilumatobacter nonamiensis]|uniref:hypothetical protein n=1 Tax=Ilumatobacter nonamiensis TaxID=467093 RepID=UPI0003495920|nr:hypothetical protein [Ilumatobacter nonamiensis]
MPDVTLRQQVLYLWLEGASIDEKVVGWAFHDGTDGAGPDLPAPDEPGAPPYRSGLRALRDGWMLLQSAQLVPPAPGQEHVNSYLEYEFVLERRVELP